MAPPPAKKTQQSSLDSFFGTKPSSASATKKGGSKQKKIESFFAPTKKNTKTLSELQNENAKGAGKEDLTDSPATEKVAAAAKRKTPDTSLDSDTDIPVARKAASSKRRVIQDDTDSDEEEAEFGEEEVAKAEHMEEDAADDHDGAPLELVSEEPDEKEERESSRETAKNDTKKAASKDTLKSAPVAEKHATSEKEVDSSTKKTAPVAAKKSSVAKDDKNVAAPKKAVTKASAVAKFNGKSAPTKASSNRSESADESTETALKDDDDEEEVAAPSRSSKSAILKAASKGQFKSDEAVLKEISSTTWEGEMPYSVLCRTFGQIEAVTSRLAIQEIMTTLFRQVMLKSCSDMSAVIYLASNSVAAAYECVELGIGDAILVKAIGQATGTNPAMVRAKYETVGDLGSVAQTFKSKQSTLGGFFAVSKKTNKDYLTANEVLKTFRQIAETKGNNSQKWKVDMIKKLLVHATDPAETKYIIRGLQGKLRIGLAESTVLISLAHAFALTIPKTIDVTAVKEIEVDDYPEEAKQYMDKSQTVEKRLEAAVSIVKKAYSEVPSYDAILDAGLKVPLQEFHKACTLTPGIPVAPMLAKPTKSVQEVLKRLNGLKFTCEYKYDGERAQVHMLPDGTTKVFSRNLLDTSEKYPEVPTFVKEACKKVDSLILDAEVVAFNPKTGQLVPFQILSTRKKTEESAETAKVQVIVKAFDLMYLNGKSLLNRTLSERRTLMHEHFEPVEGKFQFAEFLDQEENGDTAVLEEFLESAVKGQCEGLMVKTLDVNAFYEPSRRSLNWLKLKKDYLEGLGDSVDLVPLGAYHGRGKRTGVYGAYLLACYDPESEEFQSVCKIGTGFSDEDLKTLSDSLNKHKIPSKSRQYNVSDQLECDVWFNAVQVWEIKAADLSKSSIHRGADGKTGEAGRGIGLRFPRFERLRNDKRPEEATSCDQILEMYYQQDSILGGGNDDGDEDDGI